MTKLVSNDTVYMIVDAVQGHEIAAADSYLQLIHKRDHLSFMKQPWGFFTVRAQVFEGEVPYRWLDLPLNHDADLRVAVKLSDEVLEDIEYDIQHDCYYNSGNYETSNELCTVHPPKNGRKTYEFHSDQENKWWFLHNHKSRFFRDVLGIETSQVKPEMFEPYKHVTLEQLV